MGQERMRSYSDSLQEQEQEPLCDSPEELNDLTSYTRRWCFVSIAIGFVFGSVVATFFSTMLATTKRHLPAIHEGKDLLTGKPTSWFNGECGNSPTQALARGCRFDMITHSWLPPACQYDEDVEDEATFYEMHEWKWSHENGTDVSGAQARRGELLYVFGSFEWHRVHCTFTWKRLHRALLYGRNIDSYVASLHHTEHCSDLLLVDTDSSNVPHSRVFTKYPSCG